MIPKINMKKIVATNANSTMADPSLEIPFFLQSDFVYRLVLIHSPRTDAGLPVALDSYTHDCFPVKGERRGEAREANQGRQLHLGVYLQIGDKSSITAIGRLAVGGRRAVRALAMFAHGNISGTEHGGIVQRRLFDTSIVVRGN